jgi:hypothetical protein
MEDGVMKATGRSGTGSKGPGDTFSRERIVEALEKVALDRTRAAARSAAHLLRLRRGPLPWEGPPHGDPSAGSTALAPEPVPVWDGRIRSK